MKNLLQLIVVVFISATTFAQTARVQVIHNSADPVAAEVDVYVGATLALDNFAFRTATPFIDLPAGVEIALSIAPGNSSNVGDALLTVPVTLTEDETYIVTANGLVDPSSSQPLALHVYGLGREEASVSSNVDILVLHGSTDAPVVDVVETDAGAGTIVDNIAYSEYQGYLELPTANYAIEVRDETGTVTVAAYELPLETLGLEGQALVAVASGFLDSSQGPAFGVWAALSAGGALVELPSSTARVQVIHNSADAAANEVDIYIGGNLALDNFAFRTATPFIDLFSNVEVEIAVAPANSTSVGDAIATFPVTLMRLESYVVVANGIVSPSGYNPPTPFGLSVYGMGREVATSNTNTDVLVHHGSTDAPIVDVVETGVGAGTIVDDIAYGDFQGYLELPTADYRLEIRDETGTVTVASFEAPLSTLGLDGAALTVVASGFLDPTQNSDGPAFGLWVALPSGGGLIELPPSALGVEDFDINTFVMYPNPATNQLNISLDMNESSMYNLSVIDMMGRIIFQKETQSSVNTIDVSRMASGIYNISLESESKIIATKKFIKM
ncbi:MAG: hypothetical protein ACI9SJ_000971 [Flavobacteriaceae bacterium]|jgi:hypothetical protein|uniref:T9SS type A sorting domain-containing protein n=1 Tax=Candidatus Marifrigoribacter sp. Uisw_064 TaxID=3230970 RepID=UPI003AEA33B8